MKTDTHNVNHLAVNHLAARIMLAYLDPNDDEDMRVADALLLAWRNADDPAKPLSLQATVYIPVEGQDDVKRLQRAYQRYTDRQLRTGKMTKGPDRKSVV